MEELNSDSTLFAVAKAEKKVWIDPEISEVKVVDYTLGGALSHAGKEDVFYKTNS